MYISFESRDIRNICENEDEALSLYEYNVVESLKARLSEIEALDNLDNYVFSNRKSERFFIKLSKDFYLNLELLEVNRVKILNIEKNEF